MTAIAGILFDEQPEADGRRAQDAVLAKLAPRGPKGVSFWRDGRTLLAHAQSGSAPSTATFDGQDRPVRVTGDIRIDNRNDLLTQLRLTAGDVTSDAEIIARAFLQWGTASFEKLIGDFAFALWDRSDDTLYCCRDHFGVRPLFYETTSHQFAFASEAKMLPAYAKAPLSKTHLSGFLGNIRTYEPQTVRPEIKRLMPGHWLRCRDGNVTCHQYWELEVEPISPQDPVAEFQEIFQQAVADRMGAPSSTAALLSGGLDSSAITGVAAKVRKAEENPEPVRTYSIVYEENPLLDERKYINDMLATGDFAHRFLPMDGYQPLKNARDILSLQEGPFDSPGLLKSSQLYRTAAGEGIEVLLSGQGGDEVIGYGTGRLWEMAQAGQWLRIIPLVRTLNRLTGSSDLQLYHNMLERFGSGHLHTRAARWALRPLVRAVSDPNVEITAPWERYLSQDCITAMDLHERSRKASFMTPEQRTNDQQFQLKGLTSTLTGPAFENFDKSSSAAGVEMRFPFFDLRLVKFCLGLPSSEKLRPNETRSILKRGMKDIYPPSIKQRQDKTNFMPELAVGMVKYHTELLDLVAQDPHGHLAAFMDMDRLRKGLARYKQTPLETDGADVTFFWRVAMLYLWLTESPQADEAVRGTS